GKHLNSILFKRQIIDTFAIIKYLVTFDFKNSLAVTRAHIDFHKTKPRLKKQRKELLEKTTVTTHPEILDKSIVWQFFIFRKKTFRQLKNF
ncbi:MAG: glycosyltransferase family 2 protein, partial [Prolixibacteraceae bacterium]|nr:glycosyltransferase family 2 protein [Prolixibacteraceae bacterium]